MKNLFSPLTKLVAVAACALTLGSCSRAEYAMLPKGASYHGVTRATTPVPPKPQAVATAVAPVTAEAVAPTATTTSPAEVATAEPQAPQAAPLVGLQEAAAPEKTIAPKAMAVDEAAVAAAIATLPQTAPKATRVQKFAASRLMRTMSKAAGITKFHRAQDTAKTQKISGKLRTGLLFLLVGLIVGLFSGYSYLFYIISAILVIIGLVFIVMWLLDNL